MDHNQPKRNISMALLVCDDAVIADHGNLSTINETFMLKSLKSFADPDVVNGISPSNVSDWRDVEFIMDSYDVVDKMEYPSEDQIDEYEAFMITGSRADAYAQVKWIMKLRAFIVHLAKNHPRVKIFGLCFGHQVISAALGGKSVFNGKWELGPTKVHLTDTGKKVFGTQRDELTLHEIHQDIVPFVPQAFHLLGSSPVTMNQGVVSFNGAKYCFTPELAPNSHSITTFPSSLTEIHILTVQSHPEFTKPIVVELVNSMLSEPGKISDAEKADLERRMKALERSEGDGLVIGRTLWKILGVGWEDQ